MKLGIGSYTYPWAVGVPAYEKLAEPLDIFGLFARAVRQNVDVVQICDNLPLTALLPGEVNTLAKLAEEKNITVEVGTRGIGISNLRTYLRLAERLGSPILRVVIDSPGDEPTVPEVIDRLLPMMHEFADAGVRLAIENHDRFTAESLVRIVESLGVENTGIVLDTANSLGALEMPAVTAAILGKYTCCLHFKDFVIRRAYRHNLGFVIEGCPAGEGLLDLPALLTRIPVSDPLVSIILEQWTPFTGNIGETIEIEAHWAEHGIDYLRGMLTDVEKQGENGDVLR